MRVHEITCPHCGSGMKSKAGIPAGRTIPCPKCKKKFAVEAADEPELVEDFEADEPAPKKKKGPPPTPTRKPSRRDEDDETEEEEPLPRKKARRRPADDTEEEERPRKKKMKRRREEDENLYQRLKHNVLVRVLTLVVLLGILAVVGFLYYENKIKQPDDTPTRPPASGKNDLD
jgi:hypothetical protein